MKRGNLHVTLEALGDALGLPPGVLILSVTQTPQDQATRTCSIHVTGESCPELPEAAEAPWVEVDPSVPGGIHWR
jgi:hypothetical protein